MRVHVIARDSRSYIGRKCPVCNRVCRPGQTVVEQLMSFTAHRACLADFIANSYEEVASDGYAVTRTTREEREAKRKQRAEERFDNYREHLLRRYRVEESNAASG